MKRRRGPFSRIREFRWQLRTSLPRKRAHLIRYPLSVVRADTGSGKTLIAILLIRSVLSRPTTDRSLVVFTTPTTTLVAQQAAVVREQTTAKVKAFIGAEVEFWKRERWQEEIAQADVVVCTPQVWLNVLGSGCVTRRKRS